MKTRFLVPALFMLSLLAAVPSFAQTTPCTSACTATKGQPFTVAADHDGVDTDGYRLRLDGTVIQDVPVTTLATGVIQFSFPTGMSQGIYTFTISAYNKDDVTANEAISAAITLTVKRGKPKTPAVIRIIK